MKAKYPKFVHDCRACDYLGPYTAPPTQIVDLYVCRDNCGDAGDAVIARYGDDGPEYTSAPTILVDRVDNQALTEAARRARNLAIGENA